MPIFRAKSANACLRENGTVEVRFRAPDNSSVSVTMPEQALQLLAQQIDEIVLPPGGGRGAGRRDG